mmetsp:Transcript_7888/g.21595  ORF Transcript_7888/g.21595 Transcript_7888/m.21595 type:complete len:122 (-) Transcript_7888:7-372(-)
MPGRTKAWARRVAAGGGPDRSTGDCRFRPCNTGSVLCDPDKECKLAALLCRTTCGNKSDVLRLRRDGQTGSVRLAPKLLEAGEEPTGEGGLRICREPGRDWKPGGGAAAMHTEPGKMWGPT